MKHFFASVFILFYTNVFAQDTTFYTIGTVSFDTIHQTYSLTTTSSFDTIQPVKAQFPGGDSAWNKFYAETMKYPAYALEHRVEGTVYVSFNVEEEGTLTNVQIVETPHKILSEEVLRIVKLMPKWKPATNNGKPVKYSMKMPITFKIR